MGRPASKMEDKVFGRLKVISRHSPFGAKDVQWNCFCECGELTIVYGYNLRNGGTVSCGCFGLEQRRIAATTHGHSSNGTLSREYISWQHMIQRCENENHHASKNYSERGIEICKEWRESFEQFLKDMGPRPPDTTIDRINNEGNYEPGNCRWTDWVTQANNRRKRARKS